MKTTILTLAVMFTLAACASEPQRPGRTTPAETAERAVEQETSRVIRSTIGQAGRQVTCTLTGTCPRTRRR